jgi:dihydroxyacetone kinase phosphotransfer subunit
MNQSVGIVLVSHSAGLAAGLRELLGQIGSGLIPVAVAAGTADGRIGTSYEKILTAIGEADRGAGVLVLPDLGSSVLTAKAVLEDNPRPDVLMVDAPFVEGAVAAVAAASGGADLQSMARAARHARQAVKFDETRPEPAAVAATAGESAAHQASAQVVLPASLHARPAGRLAREAANYTSTIRIEHAGKTIDPTGVLAVMSLGAKLGSTVTLHADGPDAQEAVKALAAVLAEAE